MNYTVTAGPVRIGGDGGGASNATGTLTMVGYSTLITSVDDITVGFGSGCTGLLAMQDHSTIHVTNGKWMYFGIPGQGTLTMSDSATVNVPDGDMRFGHGGDRRYADREFDRGESLDDRW
jgi:hypothetical protein